MLFNTLSLLAKTLYIFVFFFSILNAKSSFTAPPLDFDTYKIGDNKGETMLLLGGIQGDEPGGFNAVNIFLMHYKIKNGSVIAVPASNKLSMLFNHRGIYGDLNRKFKNLATNDKEQKIIEKLKYLINLPETGLILHLHDGGGFWRPTYINKILNPNRWGNCFIIDQKSLENIKYGNLEDIANKAISYINSGLLDSMHKYHINNTDTESKKDAEMLKALTYYAISNSKPAFANEASKELTLPYRVYYHLRAIEYMLGVMNIEFERDFELNIKNIYNAIYDKNLTLSLFAQKLDSNKINIIDYTGQGQADKKDEKINYIHFDDKKYFLTLPFFNLEKTIPIYLPLNDLPGEDDIKDKTRLKNIQIFSKSSIIGMLEDKNSITLKYGNRVLTKLKPTFVKYDQNDLAIKGQIDGNSSSLKIKAGDIIRLQNNFSFDGDSEGFINGKKIENHINITALKKYKSIDKSGAFYKIDFFKKENTTDVKNRLSIVSVNIANIRELPKLDSKILAKAKRGSVLNVIADSKELKDLSNLKDSSTENSKNIKNLKSVEPQEGWTRVQIIEDDKMLTGYIFTKLLKFSDSNKATTSVNIANIRELPKLDSKILAKAKKNTAVKILEISNDWAQASFKLNGQDLEGYIYVNLLNFNEGMQESPKAYTGSILLQISK